METNKQQLTGIKKRQQISNANKMIFVWVIVASIAVSFCGVTVQFLFRQAAFNQKVISAKLETQGVLDSNIENVEKLKQNVDQQLLSDTNLAKVKANPDDTNLKVVLDALPTSDDKSAFGASLQQVILSKSGVNTSDITTITQLQQGIAEEEGVLTETTPSSSFSFTSSGSYDQLKAMFVDIERSIRPVNVTTVALQGIDGSIKASINGVTYYVPSQTIQLGKRTINP